MTGHHPQRGRPSIRSEALAFTSCSTLWCSLHVGVPKSASSPNPASLPNVRLHQFPRQSWRWARTAADPRARLPDRNPSWKDELLVQRAAKYARKTFAPKCAPDAWKSWSTGSRGRRLGRRISPPETRM